MGWHRLLLVAICLAEWSFAQELPTGEIYTPLEQGQYRGSERVGIWNYYDHPSKVSLTIDYSKGELLYFEEDSTPFVVLKGGKKTETRLARPCRFHGSSLPLFQHYMKSVDVPWTLQSKAEKTREPIEALLTFEVDNEGVAKNPQVLGDPGVGVARAMLKAFENAPNSWLVGLHEDGSPATCVLGIKFRVCVDSCRNAPSSDARIIFDFGSTVQTKPKQRDEFAYITNENQGIQYSPDNRRILVETTGLGYTASIGTAHSPAGLIADRETGQTWMIPFTNVNGCMWLDNDQVYFKYSLELLLNMPAVYSMVSGKVTTGRDSVTYFNVVSRDMTRIAFATRLENGSRVWIGDREKGDFTPVYGNRLTKYIPNGWSPQKDKLLISGREEGLSQVIIVDLATLNRSVIPLFNASICGWSQDQRVIYLVKFDNVNLVGTIFTYDLQTGKIAELYSKIRGLTLAVHSPEAGKLALVMRGDAYLQSPDSPYDPQKIADGVFSLGWNRTGKLLCLVGSKDRQLYEYNLETRQKRKITDWKIK